MGQQFANTRTLLTTSETTTGSSFLFLNSTATLPDISAGSGDFLLLTVFTSETAYEIVKVTEVTNAQNRVTIERAQEDTAAQTWPSGSYVRLGVTAEFLNSLSSVANYLQVDKATDLQTVAAPIDGQKATAYGLSAYLDGDFDDWVYKADSTRMTDNVSVLRPDHIASDATAGRWVRPHNKKDPIAQGECGQSYIRRGQTVFGTGLTQEDLDVMELVNDSANTITSTGSGTFSCNSTGRGHPKVLIHDPAAGVLRPSEDVFSKIGTAEDYNLILADGGLNSLGQGNAEAAAEATGRWVVRMGHAVGGTPIEASMGTEDPRDPADPNTAQPNGAVGTTAFANINAGCALLGLAGPTYLLLFQYQGNNPASPEDTISSTNGTTDPVTWIARFANVVRQARTETGWSPTLPVINGEGFYENVPSGDGQSTEMLYAVAQLPNILSDIAVASGYGYNAPDGSHFMAMHNYGRRRVWPAVRSVLSPEFFDTASGGQNNPQAFPFFAELNYARKQGSRFYQRKTDENTTVVLDRQNLRGIHHAARATYYDATSLNFTQRDGGLLFGFRAWANTGSHDLMGTTGFEDWTEGTLIDFGSNQVIYQGEVQASNKIYLTNSETLLCTVSNGSVDILIWNKKEFETLSGGYERAQPNTYEQVFMWEGTISGAGSKTRPLTWPTQFIHDNYNLSVRAYSDSGYTTEIDPSTIGLTISTPASQTGVTYQQTGSVTAYLRVIASGFFRFQS